MLFLANIATLCSVEPACHPNYTPLAMVYAFIKTKLSKQGHIA